MTRKMLIDAANEEEVRVCVLENGRVEEFDFESSAKRALRGNIYLARVTRVEPSLQAAFVEYGGNRHGFLAFNEIHPDYYQIPVSDREAIQAAEAEEAALAAQLNLNQNADEDDPQGGVSEDFADESEDSAAGDDDAASDEDHDDDSSDEIGDTDASASANDGEIGDAEIVDAGYEQDTEEVGADDGDADETAGDAGDDSRAAPLKTPDVEVIASAPIETDGEEASGDAEDLENTEDADSDDEDIEAAGNTEDEEDDEDDRETASEFDDDAESEEDDEAEEEDGDGEDDQEESGDSESRAQLMERYKEARRKRQRLLRNYKIQEVIKRRQILLVQVVKEERGNKGAALTTYMSLAGRYCVLMPNTARGGGISRKIPSAGDRKRLRKIVDGLEVPQGMGLIIRTAGSKRTKAEIKRDYDYLSRLWENIRSLTLKSIAPSLIYEEASLIKRAIRDLYDKDIEVVIVDGDAGYREAKDFMKMLMPSHAKNVQPYKDRTPLFLKHDIDAQLDAMYQPEVRLKSGGYLVINQTEALIAIDVNSGKATRERNIEQTALKTNVEAAKELARQCRLRDLAGLIVVDFIDMEEHRNNRMVEKKFKEALKIDRARVQVGRISGFGLLEMSRQRRRSGIVDGTTTACPTCGGAGVVRSDEMASLRILRAIEREALGGKAAGLRVKATMDVVLYILNFKRDWLRRIEETYGVEVELLTDNGKAGDQYEIDRQGARRPAAVAAPAVRADLSEPAADEIVETDSSETEKASDAEAGDEESGQRKRRRRRRRKKSDGGEADATAAEAPENTDAAGVETTEDGEAQDAEAQGAEARSGDSDTEDGEERPRKRRRRGRRGGRRNARRGDGEAAENASQNANSDDSAGEAPTDDAPETPADDAPVSTEQPAMAEPAASEPAAAEQVPSDIKDDVVAEEAEEALEEDADAAAAPTETAGDKADAPTPPPAPIEAPAASTQEASDGDDRKKPSGGGRKGWWQRALGG